MVSSNTNNFKLIHLKVTAPIVMKEFSTRDLEPHHQMQFFIIQKTPLFGGGVETAYSSAGDAFTEF